MKDWSDLQISIRREAHFGDRVVNCFAERPSNYFEMITRAAARNPDGEALVFNEIRLTWRELERRSSRFAKGLLSRGVRPKDRISLFLGNRTEFVIAFLACAKIGVIIVPINIREQKDTLRHLLQHSGARAIVHERALLELLPLAADVPDLSLRVCPDACEGSITFSDVYEDDEISAPPEVLEEDTLSINYTSGTTGPPKGVALTHMGVIHAAMFYSLCVGLTSADRSVISIPLSFTGGLVSALSVIMSCGGTVILLQEFKAQQFLEIAARERMTQTLMVPAMYELCIRQPDIGKYDLSSWKYRSLRRRPYAGDNRSAAGGDISQSEAHELLRRHRERRPLDVCAPRGYGGEPRRGRTGVSLRRTCGHGREFHRTGARRRGRTLDTKPGLQQRLLARSGKNQGGIFRRNSGAPAISP